ncbi:DUF4351 domain-containing protein [Duganella radicis]|uniref:DUF4351 domain-containing protein n=1 Tax=Duganella radicis TaxID=551988 RepID=A0A6L6PDN1_9BURK|nr:DUF4351 domain-containing protein [Duganella radicis]MTV36691.1 DUF4351 domain-containing protein [Duganella radicis]
MSAPTPPDRYDLPWKMAITHAVHAFMALFFADIHATIDWSKRPRFHDKELTRTGYVDTPDRMIADKLVEVCLRDGGWILLHIEVQSQRDASLAQRMLDYNYRISQEYGRPVTSLVLLADDDPHWRPHAFHHEQLGLVQHLSFGMAKLLDYAGRIDALMASDNPIAWVALAHLRTRQTRHKPSERYAAKLQLTGLLFKHRWSRKRILILFKVINWMMVLPPSYQERYWQAASELGKEDKMELMNQLEQMLFDNGMEKGMEKGLEKGLKKGLEQGRKEGAVTLLEQLLTQRFGPLPKTVRNKLAKASVEQLTAWAIALPAAQSLKHIFQ